MLAQGQAAELTILLCGLPDSPSAMVNENLLVVLVRTSLEKEPYLDAVHAIPRLDFIMGQN